MQLKLFFGVSKLSPILSRSALHPALCRLLHLDSALSFACSRPTTFSFLIRQSAPKSIIIGISHCTSTSITWSLTLASSHRKCYRALRSMDRHSGYFGISSTMEPLVSIPGSPRDQIFLITVRIASISLVRLSRKKVYCG